MSPDALAVMVVQGAGLLVIAAAAVKFLYIPLALIFEGRSWRVARRNRRAARRNHGGRNFHAGGTVRPRHRPGTGRPLVSIVVPGYNEGVVIEACVRSILASDYPRLEIILVDDGSTDDTAALMASLAEHNRLVTFISKENGGKGSALNAGIKAAKGKIMLFVDADGLFAPDTVSWMVDAFDDPQVGAVCGDDRPVNLNRVQTRMLAVLSHTGTGLVRRALSLVQCLPIVSGNSGAFRSDVVRSIGGFREDTIGEDLELTWRVHRAGYQVRFQPKALVYAESPSTLRGLWKQRVRWSRGLLQTVRMHAGMFGSLSHGPFGVFLIFNLFSMVVVPVLQLVVLLGVVYLAARGYTLVPADAMGVIGWVGLGFAVVVTVYAIALNGAWRDLRHLWTVPLWPLYSVMMAAVLVTAVFKEAVRAPSNWNKLQRTGVVSVDLGTGGGA
ncbi:MULTISPECIES: glycosyltransferase family 2 protein [Arthrobacter]|uniref:Glycosyltransferase family 2 protein n=2 Tax=Arthrobacter TaxID=1663 RepID=A0ABU9KJ38_9MICC|nr:glycosyltransferase family 2 protein [Arthrobacter sp. YJM1]MDP5226581.1 glycosyltransferase family 2 protein [Arthrobacter sp. YJM1]